VLWIEQSHLLEQMLEVIRVKTLWLELAVLFPKHFEITACQGHIEGVLWSGGVERRMLAVNDKQNDTHGKDIDLLALVSPAKVYFWSHVPVGAKRRLEVSGAITAVDRGGKPKVNDLERVVQVEHDVFGLEVPMGNPLLMAVVNAFHHLPEIVPRQLIVERSGLRDDIE
jgi:hypothetical protein